jgi:hypothetical protein
VAQPQTTGPVDIWVGIASGGTPVFLGHGERGPRIRIRRSYRPMYCDLGGDAVPFDQAHQGEMGIVSVILTRWNERVYKVIADAATTGLGGNLGNRGQQDPGQIGSLMVLEGLAYDLWLRFPFAAKTVYAAGGMPAGYHFYKAMLDQEDDHDDLGTHPKRLGLTWTCLRSFDVSVTNNYGAGRFRLYDHDLTALAGAVID